MYSILYVDDEEKLLEIGKLFLEETGEFHVDTVLSAVHATEKMKTLPYDAIVSDYQMPGMDGIVFLKTVRSRFGDIPFILFTGKGREEVVIQAINNGADFYLQKGGDPRSQYAELAHKITIAILHHQSRERINVLNRLYSVLFATNKAIGNISTKPELFFEICRILVEIGGFRMVWIGLADTEKRSIIPVASYGYIDGYLDTIAISTEDVPRGRGPTGTAYREKKYYFSNDIRQDPRLEPWREGCLKRGYRANAAFPFALGTGNAGVITLYAPVTGFYTEDIIGLLEEMSRDISFALKNIDEKEQRKSAEAAQQTSERKYKAIFDEAILGIYRSTPSGIWLDMNPAFARMYGYDTPEEMIRVITDIQQQIYVRPEDRIAFKERLARDGMVRGYETEFYHRDGHRIWMSINGKTVRDQDGEILYYEGTTEDITGRKKIETELKSAYEHIAATEEELLSQYDELKRSHAISRENEARLLRAENVGQTGHWEFHLDTKKVEYSPGAVAIYGLENKPWSIPEVQKVPLPEYRPALDAALKALIEQDTPYDIEFEIRRPADGSLRHIHSIAEYDPANHIVFGVIHDITESKRTEHLIREMNDTFSQAQTIAHLGSWQYDVGKNLIEWSDETYHIFGYEPGKFNPVLEKIRERIHPDDLPLHDRVLAEAIATHRYQTAEYRIIREDGTVRTIFGNGKVILDKTGSVVRVIGVIQDITGRVQAEEALRESEEKYRALVETSFDGILIHQDGSIVYANAPAIRLFGAGSAKEIIGRTVLSFVPPEFHPLVFKRMTSATRETQPVIQEKFLCTDGSLIDVDVVAIPFVWKNRPAVHVVFRDITERKRAEDALRNANRQLNLMTSITRHDILNKISVSLGYIGIMKKRSADPALAEYLRKLESATSSIRSEIEFTRVYQDLGTHDPQWQAVDGLLRRISVPASIALTADLEGMEVFADPMLEKVFSNLLDNSVRHGQQVTAIRVTSFQQEGVLTIVWEDNGAGIAADEKDRIFERGFGRNTGLGLFLVREILSLTGIAIRETGTAGNGARFEIMVPKGMFRSSGPEES
jgi:PAS domain S-box-containing protein